MWNSSLSFDKGCGVLVTPETRFLVSYLAYFFGKSFETCVMHVGIGLVDLSQHFCRLFEGSLDLNLSIMWDGLTNGCAFPVLFSLLLRRLRNVSKSFANFRKRSLNL